MSEDYLHKHFISQVKGALKHWSGVGGSGDSGGDAPSGGIIEVDILPRRKIVLDADPEFPDALVFTDIVPITLEIGAEYIVELDTDSYKVTANDASSLMDGAVLLGNGSMYGLPGNDEPFAILSFGDMLGVAVFDTTLNERDIRIYQSSAVEGTVLLQHKTITENGTHGPDDGYHGLDSVDVEISAPEPNLQDKTITENGTYAADEDYDGLGNVTVSVPDKEPVLQDKTITENGTYSADEGYDGLGQILVEIAGSGSVETPTILKKTMSYFATGTTKTIFTAEELASINFTISDNSFLLAFPASMQYANTGKMVIALLLGNRALFYSGVGTSPTEYSGLLLYTPYATSNYSIKHTLTYYPIPYANRLSVESSDLPYFDSSDGTIKFKNTGTYNFKANGGSGQYVFIVGTSS